MFLENISNSLSNGNILFSEDYFSIFNTEFLEGFLIVGKIKSKFPINFECLSSEDAFKSCAWFSCLALMEINKKASIDREILKTSRLINELLRLLIESHFCLTDLVNTQDKFLETKRLVNLIDLIRSLTLRDSLDVLKIQEKVFIFFGKKISL